MWPVTYASSVSSCVSMCRAKFVAQTPAPASAAMRKTALIQPVGLHFFLAFFGSSKATTSGGSSSMVSSSAEDLSSRSVVFCMFTFFKFCKSERSVGNRSVRGGCDLFAAAFAEQQKQREREHERDPDIAENIRK